jgi:hypothetical protein
MDTRPLAERRLDCPSSSVLAGRHEVRIDPQGEARIGVSEVVGEGTDRLAGVEQDRGEVVAEGVIERPRETV